MPVKIERSDIKSVQLHGVSNPSRYFIALEPYEVKAKSIVVVLPNLGRHFDVPTAEVREFANYLLDLVDQVETQA